MKNTFADSRGREVIITISQETILFHHADVVKMQEDWYNNQIELGNDVDEEEKNVGEFYYIEKSEWAKDRTERQDREDNWHKHMKRKTWFTDEMYDFINKNV